MSRMGPREPKPLGLVPRLSVDQLLWVANTRHGPAGHWFARVVDDRGDHDHLHGAVDAVDYLGRHHVPVPTEAPTAAQLEKLAAIREMIRGLVDPATPAWTQPVLGILRATRFVATAGAHSGDAGAVNPGGAGSGEVTISTIEADHAGWDGLIGDLMLPLIELVERRNDLRVCGNPHCRLVFLDLSKNHSRRWCDTTGCGNRDRVRRYRQASRPRSPALVEISQLR